MSSAQRREREKENLRRAILDAARELFATEDYRAVTMRRIAEKIEYSPTAIYLHFQDKQEILFHLIEEGFALLSARLEALQVADPVERLRQGGHVYIDFALTQPHYYRLMFQLENKGLGELIRRCETAERAFNFIRKAVTEAMQKGQFATSAPEPVVSATIWASVHGAASLALTGHLSRKLPDEFRSACFDHVIETVLRGLKA